MKAVEGTVLSAWGDISKPAQHNDFLKVTMSVNGGYNHVYERRKALTNLSKIINCSNVDFSQLDFENFIFSESSMISTNWYRNNPTAVRNAEIELERND